MALEARCAGVKESFPNTENMQVNGADDSAVTSTIQAKLSEDKSINWIVTLGAPLALDAIKAKQGVGASREDRHVRPEPGRRAGHPGRQDPVLRRPAAVRAGLHGRHPLYLYLKNGNDLGGGKAVLTGPSFVDKSNIDADPAVREAEHPLTLLRGPGPADPALADQHWSCHEHTRQDRPTAGGPVRGLQPGHPQSVEPAAGAARRSARWSRRSSSSSSSSSSRRRSAACRPCSPSSTSPPRSASSRSAWAC